MNSHHVGAFTRDPVPGRVVFGPGSAAQTAEEITALGLRRIMVIAAGSAAAAGAALVDRLGGPVGRSGRGGRAGLVAGTFDRVRQHVPEDLAASAGHTARQLSADGVLALGGGSAIGLAKAVALDTGALVLAVPTTYSGSEMTPIYGLTGRHKRVGRDPLARPRLVVYDPELTTSLPPAVTAASGFNALAHCVEALYAPGANPLTALHATAGIRALAHSLPVAVREPTDLDARGEALFGAFLAGGALATAGTALHHRLCHVLGGTFGLPHAEVNSVLLPHVAAFNRPAVPEAMAAVAAALGAADAAAGLHDLAVRLGAPTSLAVLGMPADGLDLAARRAVAEVGSSNPRPVDADGLRALLDDAHHGRSPVPPSPDQPDG
ncbi:MAG TPA: maleylacetate reductase [Mycobacteriales bacterium]|nr:maleylacetate reductase [Mycobacteriales bacterium]